MDITYTFFPPELMAYKDKMPESMTFIIKGKKVRREGPTGFGGYQIFILDFEKEDGYVAMQVGNGKLGYRLTHEDFKAMIAQQIRPDKIEYTDESKTIAGFLCHKALVYYKGLNHPLDVFYTPHIPAFAQDAIVGINGFPLYYEMSKKGMTYFAEAVHINPGSVDDSMFEFPKGYTIVTKEEFRNELINSY